MAGNGIMMYEGETEKESRDSLNMVEQMKIMYGAIKLAVIHGATLSRGDQRRGVNFICFYYRVRRKEWPP